MKTLCVRQGSVFSPGYVRMIQDMLPGTICLTDMPDTPGETRPLRTDLPGWWSKLELFAPWNEDLRPCFFLDLDTYVLGDIRDILENPGEEFWLIDDFYDPKRGQTGLMIVPRETNHIWREFGVLTDLPKYGDAEFLRTFPHRRLPKEYGGIKSYKADKLQDNPGDASIVCFHGKPKPHECTGWAGEIWSRYETA